MGKVLWKHAYINSQVSNFYIKEWYSRRWLENGIEVAAMSLHDDCSDMSMNMIPMFTVNHTQNVHIVTV